MRKTSVAEDGYNDQWGSITSFFFLVLCCGINPMLFLFSFLMKQCRKNQSRTFRRIQHQPNIRMPRQRQRLLSTLLRSVIFHDTKVVNGKVLWSVRGIRRLQDNSRFNMQMRSMYSIGEGAVESGVELLLLEFEAEKGKIMMHGPGLQV